MVYQIGLEYSNINYYTLQVARNYWYTNAVKNNYIGQYPSLSISDLANSQMRPTVAADHTIKTKNTNYSNLKLCKYTIGTWKINILKQWIVQDQK